MHPEPPLRSKLDLLCLAAASGCPARTSGPSSESTGVSEASGDRDPVPVPDPRHRPASHSTHFVLVCARQQLSDVGVQQALKRSAEVPSPYETFWGHVAQLPDATALVEAVAAGILRPFDPTASEVSFVRIWSGSCLVLREDLAAAQGIVNGLDRRWGLPHRQGAFWISREIDIHSTHQQPRYIYNGLCKKWIQMQASTGGRFHVVCYFYPSDVAHMYDASPAPTDALKTPRDVPALRPFYPSGDSEDSLHRQRREWMFCDEEPKDGGSEFARQGFFQFHPIFHMTDPMQRRCVCGGLGARRAEDYFRDDPDWTEKLTRHSVGNSQEFATMNATGQQKTVLN
ncbi:hypothetical protein BC830DRAFT_1172913 [Chytriomyces sp. MP71]|nr:hypothetical protein BC830DRAFT_1172913 [Chytriomyces sp. MP71]